MNNRTGLSSFTDQDMIEGAISIGGFENRTVKLVQAVAQRGIHLSGH